MKTSISVRAAQKVCVMGGFTEGSGHAKKLAQLLRVAGFGVVRRPGDADVIITHSGGYLFLPDDLAAKTVVMIAPPCGYQAGTISTFFKAWRFDYAAHKYERAFRDFWHKNSNNVWYLLTRAGRNIRIARGVPKFRFELFRTHAKRTIVITNRNDLWAKNMPAEAIQANLDYAFVGLEGAHDDIWLHPERYVAVVRALV